MNDVTTISVVLSIISAVCHDGSTTNNNCDMHSDYKEEDNTHRKNDKKFKHADNDNRNCRVLPDSAARHAVNFADDTKKGVEKKM